MKKVILTYFKVTGKYYSEGTYNSNLAHLHDIWTEVRAMQNCGKLPGISGGNEFIILVEVPEHEHNHPRLIV